jgi:cytoskeletal protein CcmA (bactofilin family)
VETVVGEGSILEGKVIVAEGIRVDGVVTGRLEVGGNIRIGRTGQVVANVICGKDGVVAGRVEGDLVCKGEIRLEASAVVLGDVSGGTLVVEDGAVLRGLISVGNIEESIEKDAARRAANG